LTKKEDYAQLIVRGGMPALVGESVEIAHEAMLDYVENTDPQFFKHIFQYKYIACTLHCLVFRQKMLHFEILFVLLHSN
jgi:hypothetical protein